MRSPFGICFLSGFLLTLPIQPTFAACCDAFGGIRYCDSSAGRYVCDNGDYSSCYCTRHAIMDLQKIAGCCLWQGGVFKIGNERQVICNDGSVSEICTIQNPADTLAIY